MAALVAVRPALAPGRRIAAGRNPRKFSLRCTAAAHKGEPEREALSRRTLLGAGLALGLAALPGPRRAWAAEGDAAPAASPEASAGSKAASPGRPQERPGAGAPGGEGAADASGVPLSQEELEQQAAAKLLEEEEERRRARRRKKGRIRELEEIRAELAEKELVLLEKEKELLEREQTVMVLREELEIEKKLRTLLTKEKEKAEEEATLAMGLCTGGSMLP
ncbi:hypothetical protein ABPG77_011394 [Micractinium sp. CCAP 211/92]